MGRLDNKVALVSGGARGLGAAETTLFAREGAKVVFGDVRDEEGRVVEAEIRALGCDATYVHMDVTKESDWREAVKLAETRYGNLNILVNNAGISRPYPIEDTTEELWDEVMAVNAKGVFFGTKLAIPAMRRAGGGSIINLSSVSGLVAIGQPAYVASKGAVRLFSKAIAIQHAKDGIRCNSIHPGTIDTPMFRERPGGDPPDIEATKIPLGRLGIAEDIALGALYLASDESSFVTGAELVIDGGLTAQ